MLQEPFPGDPPDDFGPDGDPRGPEQGLFVCLPAEELSLAGFAQNGRADTMAPGPLLATVLHAAVGDDASGMPGLVQLTAMRELARRRPAVEPGDSGRAGFSDFAADELMGQFHLTWESATAQIVYACAVADRLPLTFAALAAGKIHPVAVKIIEDETRYLSPEHAAEADQVLAEAAQVKSFARLRHTAHRLVLKLDPGYAQRRKDETRKYAHVRRFRENSGNAGMVAREMPSDEVLASWQHVEQRAIDLRAAGMPGTMQELRVRAFLDLLQETDSRAVPADPAHPAGRGKADPDQPPPASEPPSDGPDSNGGPGGRGGPGCPGGSDPDPASVPGLGAQPSFAALVHITVPLETAQGRSETPGEVGGFGLVDGPDSRDLVAAAARHPGTRWCITALNPDGTAAGHGCASGRHPPPGLVDLLTAGGPDPPPGVRPEDYVRGAGIHMLSIARGSCGHDHAETGYRPSRTLQHLVRARSARCAAPGCSRPAARCDLDHTVPWDQGGLTCECDLAPPCKR